MSVKEYRELTKPLEKTIQSEVIGYLRSLGYYVLRLNAGAIPVVKNGRRRIIRMAKAGTPDILAFRGNCIHHYEQHAEILFLEIKREGNSPTILQQQIMQELEGYGARCLVVHSVSELETLL